MQSSAQDIASRTGGAPVSQESVPAGTAGVASPVATGPGSAPAPAATGTSAGQAAPPAATLVYLTPVGDFIHGADAKAATILGVLGIMFTLLARFGTQLDAMIRGAGGTTALTVVLLAGFAGAALGAVVQSFRTISPRFPRAAPSLAFFGDIARLTPEEYVARVSSLGARAALAERMAYNHTGARIILLKFRQLRLALRFFEVAAACWLVLFALLALGAFRA